MITLDNIGISFGARTLFEDATITFNEGSRYGLTGPNGAGKSSLFKVIAGQAKPTAGNVARPENIGVLKQDIESFQKYRVIDTVIMGNKRLWDCLSERDRLYSQEFTDEIGMRLGEIEEIIGETGGYTAESDAEELLEGVGIHKEFHEQELGALPTDDQFKVLLCQALFGNPQALLLDEPTNHLDMESITWLEHFLESYKGTVIVISHDRHFLNSVCTHIADIDYETIILYPGNYDSMVSVKSQVRQRELNDIKAKTKKIAQLKDFVAKFGAGTRASQVQSRVREIERLKPQDLKESNIQRPYIRFIPSEKNPGKILIKMQNVSKGYDGLEVIRKFSLEIDRDDKIGVIGANGRGKTTLLKLLAQVLSPDSGNFTLGHNVLTEYFPQNHQDIVDKKRDVQAFDWLKEGTNNALEQEVRGAMGKMLFGGDDAFKKVPLLSGGETARLILARMMLSEHNFLILDEPNNHLDLEAVSALAWGLQEYKGTVVVASHDRDLITHVAKKIIAFEEDGIHVFNGTLDEYLLSKDKVQSKNL